MNRNRVAAVSVFVLCVACACTPMSPEAPADDAPAATGPATTAASGAEAATPDASMPSRAAVLPSDAEPGFVLPGDFAESTTLADLQERFGPHEVLVDESPQDDGGVRRRVILFPDEPARRAYVEFHDAEALAGVASISVRDRGSIWRGKGGVHVGMSLAELRRANGGPFFFSGFDELGRAWVRDQWSPALDDAPRLGHLDVGSDDRMYFGVDLALTTPLAALPPGTVPRDDSVSSDAPEYPRLDEFVEVAAIVASTSLDDEWE
jgi:hypothetical protein